MNSVFSKMREFVQHVHLIGFYDVFDLPTKATSWFVYLDVCFYSLSCRLGRHRWQPATSRLIEYKKFDEIDSKIL